jgi:hypothetical protein
VEWNGKVTLQQFESSVGAFFVFPEIVLWILFSSNFLLALHSPVCFVWFIVFHLFAFIKFLFLFLSGEVYFILFFCLLVCQVIWSWKFSGFALTVGWVLLHHIVDSKFTHFRSFLFQCNDFANLTSWPVPILKIIFSLIKSRMNFINTF